MGSVLIILIGLSVLAFLLTDLLGPNSVLLGGGGANNVGEIAGENISREEYQQQVEEFKYNFQANNGRTPSESEMASLRQQAWDYLIIKIAFQEQYDELGVNVTNEELVEGVKFAHERSAKVYVVLNSFLQQGARAPSRIVYLENITRKYEHST